MATTGSRGRLGVRDSASAVATDPFGDAPLASGAASLDNGRRLGRPVERRCLRGRSRNPQFMMAAMERAMSSLERAPIRTSRTFPSGPMKKWVGTPIVR